MSDRTTKRVDFPTTLMRKGPVDVPPGETNDTIWYPYGHGVISLNHAHVAFKCGFFKCGY